MINLLLILLCGVRFDVATVSNNRPVVLCWGDSNTMRGEYKAEDYPNYLLDEKDLRIQIVNAGVSEDTIVDMMDRFATDVEPFVGVGDYIIILGGLNDDLQGADADSIIGLVRTACALAATTGAEVLISTYSITAGEMFEVNDSIQVYHTSFADGIIDQTADAYIGEAADHSNTDWFDNVYHYSAEGRQRYAELYVAPAVRSLL